MQAMFGQYISVQTNIYFEPNQISNMAKLTESNNEYYSCFEIYSNNIRIVQGIRIISNAKMKDLLNYQKKLCFMKMPSVLMIIRPKSNYHSYSFLLKKYLFKLKTKIKLL